MEANPGFCPSQERMIVAKRRGFVTLHMLNNQQSPEKNIQPRNFQIERQKITKFLNNANLKVGFATVLTSCWCWRSNCVHLRFAMGSNSVTLPRPMSSWTLSICPVSWLKTSLYSIYAIYVYIFAMGCLARCHFQWHLDHRMMLAG